MVLRFFMNTNERSHQYFKVNTEVIWLEFLCNKRKSLFSWIWEYFIN